MIRCRLHSLRAVVLANMLRIWPLVTAPTEDDSSGLSRLRVPQLTRLTSDSRMKRLSLGVSAEMKRSSLGKSHLSAEELARLERMVILLGYIVTAARRIASASVDTEESRRPSAGLRRLSGSLAVAN